MSTLFLYLKVDCAKVVLDAKVKKIIALATAVLCMCMFIRDLAPNIKLKNINSIVKIGLFSVNLKTYLKAIQYIQIKKFKMTTYKKTILSFIRIVKAFINRFRSHRGSASPIIYQKVCCQCARPVVTEVVTYCLRHPSRFEGKIYCKEHQYPFFNNMPGLENQLEKQAKIYAQDAIDYD